MITFLASTDSITWPEALCPMFYLLGVAAIIWASNH